MAKLRDGAAVALWAHRIAAGLSERDEVAVAGLPVSDRQDPAERHQMPRLVVVEADGEDELFDLGDGETAEVVGVKRKGYRL